MLTLRSLAAFCGVSRIGKAVSRLIDRPHIRRLSEPAC
jgi:hypothetical protein